MRARDQQILPDRDCALSRESVAIEIATLTVIAGNLAPRALGLVMEWAAKHQEELLADWELAMEGNLPAAIEPLR